MRIEWADDVPAEIRAIAEPLVDQLHVFLPRWVEVLVMRWSEDNENCLSTTVRVEYRNVNVFIHPGFLSETPRRRYSCVLHEFIHVAIEPLRDVFIDLGKSVLKDSNEPLAVWAQEQWRKAMECAVVDLEYGIGRLREAPSQTSALSG